MQQRAGVERPARTGMLVSRVYLNAFNKALISWILVSHITLTVVEVPEFRPLILLLNPGIFDFLYKSCNCIRNVIIREFKARKERVRQALAQAKSKIHVGFDLWTSPASVDCVAVVVHYVGRNLKSLSLLIALKEMEGSHSNENIAAAILPVFGDFRIEDKLGFFISDNVTSNDRAVNVLCGELDLGNPVPRRLRCLEHVINLSAKAFLYSNEEGSFDFEAEELSMLKFEVRKALELLLFWPFQLVEQSNQSEQE